MKKYVKIRKYFFLLLICFGGATHISAQVAAYLIQDGSFETDSYNGGYLYIATPPWRMCGPSNSPDYQPGYFDVVLPAYHGDHYVGLAQHGGILGESVTQTLKTVPGQQYFMVMYLASSPTYYIEPDGRLSLLHVNATGTGQSNVCHGKDTLWISPSITENKWRRVVANFQIPDTAASLMNLQFKVLNVPGKSRGCNILLDSISGPFQGQWPLPDLGPDRHLCVGDSVTFSFPRAGSPNIPYGISYRWNDGSVGYSKTIHKSGTYSVCSVWKKLTQCDTVDLFFEDQPEIDLPGDTLLCTGEEMNVRASVGRSGYSYYWNVGVSDSTLSISDSRTAVVEVTNGACSVTDSLTILFRDCSATLEMPNVFSPNCDGINDVFRPMNAINIYSIQIDIFDRWGRKVAVLRSLDQGWDGRNSLGQTLPEGVYFWAARYQGVEDEEVVVVKGNVVLVR